MTKKRKYKNKGRKKKNIIKLNERRNNYRNNDKLYSPQIVATIYKYTIENNLTNKREKKEKKKHTHVNKWHVLYKQYYLHVNEG